MLDGCDRGRSLALWSRPVTDVRFVDVHKAEALARQDIHTVGDLLRHYPFRHLDLSHTATLAQACPGTDATVMGTIHDIKVKRPRPRLSITEVAIVDGTGALIGVWFNQPYIAQRYRVGERVAFAGRVELDYGLKQMRSPFVERLDEGHDVDSVARILPIHRATEGLSTNWMRRLVFEALTLAGDVSDPLPASLRQELHLVSLRHALSAIHFPDDADSLAQARRRLAYEELLILQLGLRLRRRLETDGRSGHAHTVDGPCTRHFRDALPFTLTDDQDIALGQISADLASSTPMNRMLLGDVGTGKTAVACGAMVIVADSGTQVAMMAPTEVLASQYATKIGPLLDDLGISWCLLTGSTTASRRRTMLDLLASGEITVAFGTHALIQQDVIFKALTLAVVDEQHRFGVAQRLALRSKGEAPDLLVMTATPIPRSLALTLYGDLDTSYLRRRPGDRGEDHVRTKVVPRAERERAYEAVRTAVADGRQAYIVCALVDESDAAQARAATSEAERLRTKVFPDLRVGLLTGQMRPAEKTAIMQRFRDAELDILVATTVIEVGVDVPNATIMLIEDAERFGLAQLHQLRGRVGRGEHPGEVFLFADPRTADGKERMAAIESTNDGFLLADTDLRLRGEGDLLGQRQSGLPILRLARITDDLELISRAHDDAERLLDGDPDLSADAHALLRAFVAEAFEDDLEAVDAG